MLIIADESSPAIAHPLSLSRLRSLVTVYANYNMKVSATYNMINAWNACSYPNGLCFGVNT
jgi:hypothetical protein